MASKRLILSVCLLFVFAATFIEAARLNSKAKCGGYGAPIDVTLENYKEKVKNGDGVICRDLMCKNGGVCYQAKFSFSNCICPRGYTGILCQFEAFKPMD